MVNLFKKDFTLSKENKSLRFSNGTNHKIRVEALPYITVLATGGFQVQGIIDSGQSISVTYKDDCIIVIHPDAPNDLQVYSNNATGYTVASATNFTLVKPYGKPEFPSVFLPEDIPTTVGVDKTQFINDCMKTVENEIQSIQDIAVKTYMAAEDNHEDSDDYFFELAHKKKDVLSQIKKLLESTNDKIREEED